MYFLKVVNEILFVYIFCFSSSSYFIPIKPCLLLSVCSIGQYFFLVLQQILLNVLLKNKRVQMIYEFVTINVKNVNINVFLLLEHN